MYTLETKSREQYDDNFALMFTTFYKHCATNANTADDICSHLTLQMGTNAEGKYTTLEYERYVRSHLFQTVVWMYTLTRNYVELLDVYKFNVMFHNFDYNGIRHTVRNRLGGCGSL